MKYGNREGDRGRFFEWYVYGINFISILQETD